MVVCLFCYRTVVESDVRATVVSPGFHISYPQSGFEFAVYLTLKRPHLGRATSVLCSGANDAPEFGPELRSESTFRLSGSFQGAAS